MDGRAEFNRKLDQIRDTFNRKNAGYAGADNPDAWANFRHSEGFGVRPSTGVLVRISDKFARLQALTRNPENDQVGESREDSALDMAVYSIIYACLLEEEGAQGLPPDRFTSTQNASLIIVQHERAAHHRIDELCYAPEMEMTFLCRAGNT